MTRQGNLLVPANISPKRSESQAKSAAQLFGALVERARVVTVNSRDYTCDVTTEFTFKNKFDIPFMSPYCNQIQGEGINFMPEVGAVCWICTPSEEGREAFILGWTMVDEGGSYRGGREMLNPGDLHFKTRDGNFLFLRRGGIVQIGSTPVCQRVYLPIRNIIQDYAENYELHTPAGDLTWQVLREEEDGDGHKACLYTLAYKEFADDPNENPIGVLKMGSHGEGNDTILSLLTRDEGGGTTQTSLEIDKAGELTWTIKKFTFHVEGDADITVDGLFTLAVLGAIDISAVGALTASAASMALSAGGATLALGSGGAALNGPQVGLGDAEFPVLRASPDFVAWIGTVTALLFSPVPVPALKGPITPPVLHTSPKVKA